ncbi:MAG: CoB--CoM heterodisulfide reductase iron-sulfur subunit B family protein [candidate division WOR-3 bacterium]
MRYTYYPGCTLYSKAKNLDRCGREAMAVLGVELTEMPSWNCCGAIYNTSSDDLAAQVGPVRNLAKASQLGEKLITLCAACHNVLKRAQERFFAPGNEIEQRRLKDFVDEPFERPVTVLHYLEVLKDEIGWEAIKERVKKPLSFPVASYYGCLMVRPKGVLKFDDPENPQVMDELITALGGQPVRFDFKTECCGGYLVVNRREVAKTCSMRIIENARTWGASAIATTCPLCQYNLEIAQVGGEFMPIFYFTQLLGLALGIAEKDLGFEDNKLNPVPFLKEKGLI